MGDDIYLDKIKLGAMIVQKELTVIETYNRLVYEMRSREDIKEFLNQYPTFNDCWQGLAELYDFLENDYLKKISKEDQGKIQVIMKKYRAFESMGMEQLTDAVSIARKIMSASKFHDVVRKSEGATGLDKIRKRYNLPGGGKPE